MGTTFSAIWGELLPDSDSAASPLLALSRLSPSCWLGPCSQGETLSDVWSVFNDWPWGRRGPICGFCGVPHSVHTPTVADSGSCCAITARRAGKSGARHHHVVAPQADTWTGRTPGAQMGAKCNNVDHKQYCLSTFSLFFFYYDLIYYDFYLFFYFCFYYD